jgi:hypothetical protein
LRPALTQKHLTSFQIAEDRVITVSFAASKLIKAQKMRSAQRQVFIHAQPFSLECLQGNGLKTLLNKAWTDSGGLGDMRDRLGAGMLADLFSQAHGRLPSPATRLILFASRIFDSAGIESGVSARSVRLDALVGKYLVSFWVEYHGFLRTFFDNEGRVLGSLLPSPQP